MSSNGTPTARDQRPLPRPRRRAAAVTLALAGVLATTAPIAQAAAHGGGGESRCGGRGVGSGALIRYESDILVKAPLRTVSEGGVRVHTEETWTGDQVEADVRTATEALGQGLEAWLRDLKATAEAHSGGRPH
ncbi:hypothetical protein ABZ214_07200 [Streptomyces iakyrus]|uniref:hypothetical protein n=1 Tax=Streptomyces iakyrus TaxID=68219 RepID=UPI0033ABD001